MEEKKVNRNEDMGGEIERERLEGVWKTKLRNVLDFHEASDGDHIIIQFECNLCIFRKLRKVEHLEILSTNKLLLVCIRRMNLDSFWSQARSTVAQNTRHDKTSITFPESLGVHGTF